MINKVSYHDQQSHLLVYYHPIQNENDYRLRGNSVTMDEDSSEITKGVFTTCKKRDDCPPWQFSAKKIKGRFSLLHKLIEFANIRRNYAEI